MPKNKTHSGASKRFKVTGSGKLMRAKAGKRHHLEAKPSKVTRRLSGDRRSRQERRPAHQEAARSLTHPVLGGRASGRLPDKNH